MAGACAGVTKAWQEYDRDEDRAWQLLMQARSRFAGEIYVSAERRARAKREAAVAHARAAWHEMVDE